MGTSEQGRLFEQAPEAGRGCVVINRQCCIVAAHGHRVVSVSGITLAHYEVGDRAAEAFAMVCLVDHGWAKQKEVATAFGCSTRTVRRHQSRF